MSEVIGNKSDFEQEEKIETKENQEQNLNQGNTDVQGDKASPKQMTEQEYQEYLELKKYQTETSGIIAGLQKLTPEEKLEIANRITRASIPQDQGYYNQPQPTNMPINPNTYTPSSSLTNTDELSPEEKEFLETFPAAKRIFEENRALKSNMGAFAQAIGELKKETYNSGVRNAQREIESELKALRQKYPDLRKDDIDSVLLQASGIYNRNPSAKISVYELGETYAKRIGLQDKSENKGNAEAPTSGGADMGSPQQSQQQTIRYEHKDEVSTFDELFDKAYQDTT